jgi:hypothetical protein
MLQRWFRRVVFRKFVALNIGNYVWGYIEKLLVREETQGEGDNSISFYDKLVQISKEERSLQKVPRKLRKTTMERYLKVLTDF